jgi:hypothetical protein
MQKRDASPDVFAKAEGGAVLKPLLEYRQSKSTLGINLDVLADSAPKTIKSPTTVKATPALTSTI